MNKSKVQKQMKSAGRKVIHILKRLITGLGIFISVLFVFAFTRVPFDVHRWLGKSSDISELKPDALIMMGGSGMPSESNLIRLYYVASLAEQFPATDIYILHPTDTAVTSLMAKHLTEMAVATNRIHLSLKGTNTREQALELYKKYPGLADREIVLVSSPENMYRSLRVFRKAGFPKVKGVSAFENAMFVSLKYDHSKIGGTSVAPDVSDNLDLRYNFWNYLKLEITCLREFTAIAYYKLNGWI